MNVNWDYGEDGVRGATDCAERVAHMIRLRTAPEAVSADAPDPPSVGVAFVERAIEEQHRARRERDEEVAALRAELRSAREPISGRHTCQRCGRCDGLDAVVPDHIWSQLQAAAGGVNILCLWCMDALADVLGIKYAAGLYFAGIALHADHTVEHREASMIAVRAAVAQERERLRPVLTSAMHALRSYRYGNSAPDLAEEVADVLASVLSEPEAGSAADATKNERGQG